MALVQYGIDDPHSTSPLAISYDGLRRMKLDVLRHAFGHQWTTDRNASNTRYTWVLPVGQVEDILRELPQEVRCGLFVRVTDGETVPEFLAAMADDGVTIFDDNTNEHVPTSFDKLHAMRIRRIEQFTDDVDSGRFPVG